MHSMLTIGAAPKNRLTTNFYCTFSSTHALCSVQFVKDERARSKKKKGDSARGVSPQSRRGVSPHAMSTGGETGTSEGGRSRGTSPGARSDALSTLSGAAGGMGPGGTNMQTAAQLALSITQNMSSPEPSVHGQVCSQKVAQFLVHSPQQKC